MKKILIIGIGNTFRSDDGLGIYTVNKLSKSLKKVDFRKVHQLDITQASEIKDYDLVIFIDSHQEKNLDDVYIKKIKPKIYKPSFTSHTNTPSELLGLVNNLYKKTPNCYLIAIKGYKFAIGNKISPKGEKAAKKAIHKIKQLLNLY